MLSICFALSLILDSSPQKSSLPAILVENPAQMLTAYEKGRTETHSKGDLIEFCRKWAKDLGRVRSLDGYSWTAPSATLMYPNAFAELQGYIDAREYKSRDQFLRLLSALENYSVIDSQRHVRFQVTLYAWPGVGGAFNRHINRAANPGDVEGVTFVLLPDGDPEKAIHLDEEPKALQKGTINGTVSIPETNSASINTYGTGGSATSTVTYTTYTAQGYQAYEASYSLAFPVIGKDGKVLIPSTTKTLVLKVVRSNGEHTATFKLSDYH